MMNDKPKLSEYVAAKKRGDLEAAEELLGRIHAWHEANPKPAPPPPRANVAGDLRDARRRNDLGEAKALLRDAHKQEQSHLLEADDLVWFVEMNGAFESSWDTGSVIAEWLYHHGPVHSALVRVAEDIASYDNTRALDDALLWLEPTPDRWFQCALWRAGLAHMDLCSELKQEGREPPDSWDTPELRHRYKQCAVEWYADHARRVIEERRDAARRSLRAAPDIAVPGRNVRLILEAWKELLT